MSAGDIRRGISVGDHRVRGYLRALGKKGSHNLGLIRLQLPTEVSFEHRSGHSDYLLVTKGETQQCPPIPCSRVTQAILFEMEMETVMVEDMEL